MKSWYPLVNRVCTNQEIDDIVLIKRHKEFVTYEQLVFVDI